MKPTSIVATASKQIRGENCSWGLTYSVTGNLDHGESMEAALTTAKDKLSGLMSTHMPTPRQIQGKIAPKWAGSPAV